MYRHVTYYKWGIYMKEAINYNNRTHKSAFTLANNNNLTPNRHPAQAEKSVFTISDENNLVCSCHPELVSGSYKCTLKNNNKQHKKTAFTLAELLTAILIISVIMVALAPVITKRMKDSIAVTTDNKKGLEIFTNPGTYTFDVPIGINTLFLQGAGGGGGGAGATSIDKSITLTSNTTWTVPKGVNKLTFTITGAGGGGGGGYYKTASDYYGSCQPGSNRIPYMALNGQDLCVTKIAPETSQYTWIVKGKNETCSGESCCWISNNTYTGCNKNIYNKGYNCGAIQCTKAANESWCGYGKNYDSNFPFNSIDSLSNNTKDIARGRLLSELEYNRIVKFAPQYLGASGLDLCFWEHGGNASLNITPIAFPRCSFSNWCTGSSNNYCYNIGVYFSRGYAHNQGWYDEAHTDDRTIHAYSVLCVRNLTVRELYSGAGGYSGAGMEKSINVLPGDKLEITIGKGGEGGSAQGGAGKQGGTTQIVHKRASNTLGTYYVKGGLGGAAAKSGSSGENTAEATPDGTCYAKYKNKVQDSTYVTSKICNILSYAGKDGDDGNNSDRYKSIVSAGDGGKFKNEGTAAKGASLDSGDMVNGRGYSATQNGFGGGGGFCARGKTSCDKGGKGADGKIEIKYTVMLPGAGGGAGTRVGGADTLGVAHEIKYKVKEGSRIVFEVGAGGAGGAAAQDGANGMPTVIGDEEIIFLAGEGAKAVTQTQKDSLNSCIGTNISSTAIANCIDNTNYKSKGGLGSYITTEYKSYSGSNALGLDVNTSNVSYTVANTKYKGDDGKQGSQSRGIAPFIYGFDGGAGASPFGILQNNVIVAITCGGGLSGNDGLQNNPQQYICTTGNINGNNAKTHDAANNEFGGSGGGGGGVVDDSFELGSGGSGSSGYLRIRWDASEQE